jgi:hypothetical protein
VTSLSPIGDVDVPAVALVLVMTYYRGHTQPADSRGLCSFLFPERCGQHPVDLVYPPAISTMLGVIAAVLNLFIWVITATLAIPIHKQLDQVKSTELIGRLVKGHLYLRLFPG